MHYYESLHLSQEQLCCLRISRLQNYRLDQWSSFFADDVTVKMLAKMKHKNHNELKSHCDVPAPYLHDKSYAALWFQPVDCHKIKTKSIYILLILILKSKYKQFKLL